MKIALCFIISYEHILNKELIWREWIEENKDIINVYFYYKDLKKIKSKWIMEHTIPLDQIYETTYYHVIPAYLSLLHFAFNNDNQNKWFDDFILNAPGKIHLLKSNYEFLHRTFIELCDLNTMKFQAKKEELTDVQLKTMDELGLRKDGRRKKKSRKKSKINL